MTIGVKTAPALGAIASINGGIDEIERALDALQVAVSTLESQWDGDARAAMSVAVRDWNESIDRMRRIGREANRVAQQSVERVDAFDRGRAGAWHR